MQLPSYHPKEIIEAPVGADLRFPWAEVTEIPYSGALDEFYRKKARNDHPLMALWEMGIRKLRIPSGDLLDAATRERMVALKAVGHEFTVFNYGLPQGRLKDILARNNTLVRVLELILPWQAAATYPGQRASTKCLRRCAAVRSTARALSGSTTGR